MISDVEHFFIYLLAMSSFEKYLLGSYTYSYSVNFFSAVELLWIPY
jgi:hypothetical protein